MIATDFGRLRAFEQKRGNAPHSKRWREFRGALDRAKPLECGAFRRFCFGRSLSGSGCSLF